MKYTPTLFSGEMVRATLEGRKTVTRRVCKFNAAGRLKLPGSPKNWHPDDPDAVKACPYGQPGDRLVFLCTWAVPEKYDKVRPTLLPVDVPIWTLFDGTEKPSWAGKLRPGRFMPKWMRFRMPKGEVTGVRVERLHDMKMGEFKLEGVSPEKVSIGGQLDPASLRVVDDYIAPFMRLWDSLNAKRGFGWDKNPLVWVVEFSRLHDANHRAPADGQTPGFNDE